MKTLFEVQHVFPDGFSYFPDFLTPEEEATLISEIGQIELHTFNFHGYEARRKVKSFGYDYHFNNRSITKGDDIPAAFNELLEKVSGFTGIAAQKFEEVLVTEYPVGSVINWHRDAPPFDVIVGISLGSDCIFRLRPYDKQKQGRSSIISFSVKRRSLYVIQRTAGSDWEHSIRPVKEVRYSVTLRTLR